MFFNKPWSEVIDEEIVDLSNKMKNEMGGWIFHTRINFETPTKWITLDNSHPSIMSDWLERRK